MCGLYGARTTYRSHDGNVAAAAAVIVVVVEELLAQLSN